MKKMYLFLFILFNFSVVFAETPVNNDPRNSMIGFGLGYTFAGFRESTIADINRYINTFVFSIYSVIEKGSFLHSHTITLFSGKNNLLVKYPNYLFEEDLEDYYKVKDTYSRFFLEYALARKLWGNNIFPGYVGGAIRGDLYLIETLYNPVYMNVTAIASFNLYVNQKWNINNKNSLGLSISLPVIGYALRPHYIGVSAWPLESGITSLHNYYACFGNLKYFYRHNTAISFYSDIGFELSHIDFPKTRKDAALQVKIGVVYMY